MISAVFTEIIRELGTRQRGIEELTPTLVGELSVETRVRVEKQFNELSTY